MHIHVYKTEEEVLSSLAGFVIENATKTIALKGQCNVMLSGGGSPKRLYELLASSTFRKSLPWDKIFFFLGDERYVPFNNPQSNGLMIKQTLIEPLHIPAKNIFYVNTELTPDDAAKDYAEKINEHFGNSPAIFDLFLLGLGDNAHTASLFPNTTVLHIEEPTIRSVYIEELKAYRITATKGLINHSAQVVFLVYGEAKAEAVFNVIQGNKDAELYPAQLIHPTNGQLHWFLDNNAASLLAKQD